jgi:hypothetical protein
VSRAGVPGGRAGTGGSKGIPAVKLQRARAAYILLGQHILLHKEPWAAAFDSHTTQQNTLPHHKKTKAAKGDSIY